MTRVYRPDLKACSESSSPAENLPFLRGPAWIPVIHKEDRVVGQRKSKSLKEGNFCPDPSIQTARAQEEPATRREGGRRSLGWIKAGSLRPSPVSESLSYHSAPHHNAHLSQCSPATVLPHHTRSPITCAPHHTCSPTRAPHHMCFPAKVLPCHTCSPTTCAPPHVLHHTCSPTTRAPHHTCSLPHVLPC